MDFWDSRSRTIALIDNLRNFAADSFRNPDASIPITNAWVAIEGEPMNVLGAPGWRRLITELIVRQALRTSIKELNLFRL
jgi:hypothetical protein